MDWPEIIADGFPGPHDGEPPDLRRDIADELNDHLACAMQRELRRTDDPAVAEHAVLDRFGNPKRIARQLWWDAMKEQVMKDRIMIAGMIISVITCLAVGVFAWMAVQQGRETNQAILAELKSLSKPAAPSEIPGDWSMVTFRCVVGDRQGEPAVGVDFSIAGTAEARTPGKTLSKQTDNEGKVTFGPMPAGEYVWWVRFPTLAKDYLAGPTWYPGFSLRESITLYPTRHHEEVVVFPSADAFTDITFAVDWPAELKDKGFLLYCDFNDPYPPHNYGDFSRREGLRLDERTWQPAFGQVVIGPDGRIRDGWTAGLGPAYTGGYGGMGELVGQPKYIFSKIPDRTITEQKSIHRPAAKYQLQEVAVLVPAKLPDRPEAIWQSCATYSFLPPFSPPGQYPSTQPVREAPVLVAERGKLNTWTITLPEDLLREVREYLAAETQPASEPADVAPPRGGRM